MASQVDVLTLLKMDHLKVKNLFAKYHGSSDDQEKLDAINQISVEMVTFYIFIGPTKPYLFQSIHSFVEESLVYPAMLKLLPQGNEVAKECVHDHDIVKQLLAQLSQMNNPSDPIYINMVIQLEEVNRSISEFNIN